MRSVGLFFIPIPQCYYRESGPTNSQTNTQNEQSSNDANAGPRAKHTTEDKTQFVIAKQTFSFQL